jgi:hypothetical protein
MALQQHDQFRYDQSRIRNSYYYNNIADNGGDIQPEQEDFNERKMLTPAL